MTTTISELERLFEKLHAEADEQDRLASIDINTVKAEQYRMIAVGIRHAATFVAEGIDFWTKAKAKNDSLSNAPNSATEGRSPKVAL